MKVLTVMVDVTDLTDNEIDNLQLAMEVQCEGVGTLDDTDDLFDAPILNSLVRIVDEEGEFVEGTQQQH